MSRYTEAIQLFKNSQDHAWHGTVLEGLATIAIIEAWSAGHGLVCEIQIVGTTTHDHSAKLYNHF